MHSNGVTPFPHPGWWKGLENREFWHQLDIYQNTVYRRDQVVFTHDVYQSGVLVGEAALVEPCYGPLVEEVAAKEGYNPEEHAREYGSFLALYRIFGGEDDCATYEHWLSHCPYEFRLRADG